MLNNRRERIHNFVYEIDSNFCIFNRSFVSLMINKFVNEPRQTEEVAKSNQISRFFFSLLFFLRSFFFFYLKILERREKKSERREERKQFFSTSSCGVHKYHQHPFSSSSFVFSSIIGGSLLTTNQRKRCIDVNRSKKFHRCCH